MWCRAFYLILREAGWGGFFFWDVLSYEVGLFRRVIELIRAYYAGACSMQGFAGCGPTRCRAS